MTDFVRHVPVHWNDCDPAWIVFHSHYVRWMDEGFHEMAHARGVDFARLQADEPNFRGTPLVNISCSFSSPALFGDVLEHRISNPEFGGGRSFRVRHTFYIGDRLVAKGEQVRIWGVVEEGRLRAIPVPNRVKQLLRSDSPERNNR
jgi:YbgC/YbaW family acyl-CoA thioester hydrolase